MDSFKLEHNNFNRSGCASYLQLFLQKLWLGGKGNLTDTMIDRMQNYYGIAIHSKVGNLEGMKKGVLASLFHCACNQSCPLHIYCPVGPNS